MTPDELRKKITDRESPRVTALTRRLLEALEETWDGRGAAKIDVQDGDLTEPRVVERACEALQKLGWSVKADRKGDQRDGDYWVFVISERGHGTRHTAHFGGCERQP